MKNRLEQFRQHLAASPAVFAMALLGLLCGVVSALVIIGFRYAIDSGQQSFMPFGGIRIEDNIIVHRERNENMTRDLGLA